ncbi:pentatricopeptide repeat-containing protein At3g05340 [Amaranthus tricolor]|uniref:pentatricopeptide repeat-containing protein At3g05340 n=1 Tax=Amaranthus tricolor TaxID=29722 RepID=UPI002585328D|nr:pentatricopeptide repeat-containing protein At3g05340 [Amaranthus tricolor]
MKPRWISHNLISLTHPHFFFSSFITTFCNSPFFTPNDFSHIQISRLLSICGKEGNLNLGSSLHSSIVKRHYLYHHKFHNDPRTVIAVWNSLLSMYAKCRSLGDALKVFYEMPMRDTISWNSLIYGFLSCRQFEIGFKYFREMIELGIGYLDRCTFTTVLSACDDLSFLKLTNMIHGLVIQSGYKGETTIGNALITSYFKCGCAESGKHVFLEMGEKNFVTWTAVISGLVKTGLCEESLNVFSTMRSEFVVPNSLTYSSLLSACASLQILKEGKQVHGLVLKLGLDLDFCIESALMNMYSKCGSMDDALRIFNSVDKFDDVFMTIVLVGFAQNGLEEEAIQIFLKMMKQGIDIDPNMVSAILGVFGTDTSLGLGQQIHSLIIKKRFDTNLFVSNGLINMYSKCGNLEESMKAFSRIARRNSVSWNSLIAAFARHGDGLKAIQLYEEMLSEGVEPTDVTFISLLHACSHVGLVEKGMEFFESMSKFHHINPRMEHYACVVDLLGRAGRLSDAKKFIDDLPDRPGILVWQALLGACSIHGDSEMGKYAAEQWFLLEPENPAPYVQLANIYSCEGQWKDRARTIKRMKEEGLSKEPGTSWIEIERKVHSFVVCDQMHPQAETIYSVLAELFLQLVDEGYKPDMKFILHCTGQNDEGSQHEATGC